MTLVSQSHPTRKPPGTTAASLALTDALCLLVLFACPPPAPAQDCAPAPTDMVSWWPAEGSGADIQDGNDGVLVNGATCAPGYVNQAFSFDGLDDELQVPHNDNLNTGSQLTVDAWIYALSWGHGRPIAQKRPALNSSGFTFESTDAPHSVSTGYQFVAWIGGTHRFLETPAGVAATSTWQHVAATYDGAFMRIYVDGVEQASLAATGTLDANTESFVVGRNVVIPSFAWEGLIDELHVFDRALSPEEIQAIYAAGVAGVCPPGSGVAASALGFALAQNEPNPFGPRTRVSFTLPAALAVELTVFDVTGRQVRNLLHGARAAGTHAVLWDGKCDGGLRAAPGVYLYRLEAGGTALTRKMVLMR